MSGRRYEHLQRPARTLRHIFLISAGDPGPQSCWRNRISPDWGGPTPLHRHVPASKPQLARSSTVGCSQRSVPLSSSLRQAGTGPAPHTGPPGPGKARAARTGLGSAIGVRVAGSPSCQMHPAGHQCPGPSLSHSPLGRGSPGPEKPPEEEGGTP